MYDHWVHLRASSIRPLQKGMSIATVLVLIIRSMYTSISSFCFILSFSPEESIYSSCLLKLPCHRFFKVTSLLLEDRTIGFAHPCPPTARCLHIAELGKCLLTQLFALFFFIVELTSRFPRTSWCLSHHI